MRAWLAMAHGVIKMTGFPEGLDKRQLAKAFTAHVDAVRAEIPPEQLLVYQVKEGWEPLCAFLGRAGPRRSVPANQ